MTLLLIFTSYMLVDFMTNICSNKKSYSRITINFLSFGYVLDEKIREILQILPTFFYNFFISSSTVINFKNEMVL